MRFEEQRQLHFGSSSHVHQNGLLSHPQDLDAPLRLAAQRKINCYLSITQVLASGIHMHMYMHIHMECVHAQTHRIFAHTHRMCARTHRRVHTHTHIEADHTSTLYKLTPASLKMRTKAVYIHVDSRSLSLFSLALSLLACSRARALSLSRSLARTHGRALSLSRALCLTHSHTHTLAHTRQSTGGIVTASSLMLPMFLAQVYFVLGDRVSQMKQITVGCDRLPNGLLKVH